MEVMGEVGDGKRVARGYDLLTSDLNIPDSKWEEIKQQSSSEKEKGHAVGRYWVNTHPDPSWKKLAQLLYDKGEERALAKTKRYLPNGMCIS